MIVFHGSSLEVNKPDIIHSRTRVDFGPGFYVTPIYDQAKRWAEKFISRGKSGVISEYLLDEERMKGLKTITFQSYSEDWIDFVSNCRQERDITDYDIVIGGVANDRVFNTLELYFDGLIEKSEAISKLRYDKPNLQICLRTQKAIDAVLFFNRSERL